MAKGIGLDEGQERGLMVTFSQDYDTHRDNTPAGGNEDGYTLEVKGYTVTFEAEGANMRSEYSSPHGYGSFFAVGRTTRRHEGKPLSCDVEYRDLYRVKAFEVAAMAKVFGRVERSMAKADDQDGYYKTIGQYIARVARALGCAYIVIERDQMAPSLGSLDSNRGNYVFLKPGHGTDAIDSQISLWVEKKLEVRKALR